ncbi:MULTISPECIES: sulfurtransferase TusA family protein [Bacillaceae]|uniref:Sulfurtransferase TusA family protein n=1 Tax=Evansella alkalicola TaxID=745819 RepID=A0ABS6JW21_9BACI|nr:MULTISPECIES: sulfurtransferase TusA family protein [Bacillaceae]MBU9722590.1 sulfurtransferase TusA family protein [Bacillus alkalicola]
MIKTDQVLDAKGLACPMPIVKTKKTITNMEPGQVLEVQATDKGSTADLKAWTERVGHQYLGTVEESGTLHHYVRKTTDSEEKQETTYEVVVNNDELQRKLESSEDLTVVDVREEAEYSFNHIPGAISIPMGELDNRLDELGKDDEIYVICRTGTRSDLAAQKLADRGFNKVTNVVPGMSDWNGPTEKSIG